MVCPPNAANVTAIYRSVIRFCSDIETALKSNEASKLRLFTDSFVKDVFLPRIQGQLQDKADQVNKKGVSRARLIAGMKEVCANFLGPESRGLLAYGAVG